jgi:hypothetical protein
MITPSGSTGGVYPYFVDLGFLLRADLKRESASVEGFRTCFLSGTGVTRRARSAI